MKKVIGNSVLSMLAITGLIMAGSEAITIPKQFLVCTIGIIVFAGSMLGIVAINEGE